MVLSPAPASTQRHLRVTTALPLPFRLPLLLSTTTTSRPLLSFTARAEPEGRTGQGSSEDPSAKKPAGKGSGFGAVEEKRRRRGREKGNVIRRSPIERPSVLRKEEGGGGDGQQQEQAANESAFLLTWLALGSIILIEGIALAASGFLPEEWDNFFVKYLYPSFTPTVGLFIGGTVAYGVLKFLQGEQMKNGN